MFDFALANSQRLNEERCSQLHLSKIPWRYGSILQFEHFYARWGDCGTLVCIVTDDQER
jgi:hypothetical protein